MATQDKTPRELESRATSLRPTKWRPPAMLPDPLPQAGFDFRWVRIATLGEPDPTNTSMKLREGWVPVKAEDHPELGIPPTASGRYAGCVENGGLLLCKIPSEFMDDRRSYYEDLTRSQMDSVNSDLMRENSDKVSFFNEKKSVVKFGSGE